MTTSNESEEAKRPLKLNQPGKLQLKKTVETGQVRQSFSHGRSKAVTVEVKRSRTFERGSTGRMAEVTEAPGEVEAAVSETPAPARSEEHTSELQSLMRISYAILRLKKKKTNKTANI